MEIKRIQSFLATINGVEFNNEMCFNIAKYILNLIENRFNINFNTYLIEDLDELIQDLYFNSELSYSDIERILSESILNAETFNSLQFNIPYMDNYTGWINNQLVNKAYTERK